MNDLMLPYSSRMLKWNPNSKYRDSIYTYIYLYVFACDPVDDASFDWKNSGRSVLVEDLLVIYTLK